MTVEAKLTTAQKRGLERVLDGKVWREADFWIQSGADDRRVRRDVLDRLLAASLIRLASPGASLVFVTRAGHRALEAL
jgi:hypothetical protein